MKKLCSGFVLAAWCSATNSLPAEHLVQVADDFGKGVKSRILVVTGSTPTAKGATDDAGKLSVAELCKVGDQVQAEPMSALYYKGVSDCNLTDNRLSVRVTAKAFASNLLLNAKYFEQKGDFGNAAISYSEFAARMAKIDSSQAMSARTSAYLSFAKTLNYDPRKNLVVSFDPKQGTEVMTPEFAETIRAFQNENGIKATGNLDFQTLKAQADKPIMDLGITQFQQIEN